MQGFRERRTAARIEENTDDRTLAAILADMEPIVSDLDCWADVLRALGTSDEVSPLAVAVIGRAVYRAAQSLADDWSCCNAIARRTEGGDR